jgi:hypothetical protein
MLRETPTECRVVAQDLERIFNRLFTITTPIPITSTASAIESNQLQVIAAIRETLVRAGISFLPDDRRGYPKEAMWPGMPRRVHCVFRGSGC